MRVTLKRLQLQNYRSCIQTTFELDPSLSAIIGPNGAGKTNIMHGLLLLRKLLHTERENPLEESFKSACSLEAHFQVGRSHEIKFRARMRYATNERNKDELVASDQKWNLGRLAGGEKWTELPFLAFPWKQLASSEVEQSLFGDQSLRSAHRTHQLSYYADILREFNISDPRSTYKVANAISEFTMGMSYYSASQFTDPSRSPISFELEDGALSRRIAVRGRDHLPFLHALYRMWKHRPKAFSQYLDIVGERGIGLISGLNFQEIKIPANVYDVRIGGKLVRTQNKRLLVIPSVRIGRSTLSPNQLSEGTFKTLALVHYILTDRSRLLLVEEPEVCVHHGILSSVIELIKRESHQKQIVVSTHSDFVLDALTPENVFIVKRDPRRGTTVSRVPDLLSVREFAGLKGYLSESGNLGEFWKHGGLEQ